MTIVETQSVLVLFDFFSFLTVIEMYLENENKDKVNTTNK